MSNKDAVRGRRKYDDEFKAGALRMLNSGQPVRSVAESLGISEHLLYKWKSVRGTGASEAEQELAELRAKYRQLEMERDILKKALSIFSRGG
jgi:transposase